MYLIENFTLTNNLRLLAVKKIKGGPIAHDLIKKIYIDRVSLPFCTLFVPEESLRNG